MTLRGVLKTIAAAERRAQCDAERRARAAEWQRALAEKTNDLERASAEVEDNERRIQHMTTLHHDVGEALDWMQIANVPPPTPPVRCDDAEQASKRELEAFRPSFMQRLFQTADAIRRTKEDAVVYSRQEDDRIHSEALVRYEVTLNVWNARHDLAIAILSGDLSAFREVCDMVEPLAAIADDTESFSIDFFQGGTSNVTLVVNGEEAIPRVTKTLTRNGKLNTKPVPMPLFHRWYKDYVCGCTLRAGRELFACLPLERIVVNVKAPVTDSATGIPARHTILSAVLTRHAMDSVRFEQVNPSEAMRLFFSRLGFRQAEGATKIEEIQVPLS